MNNMENLFEYFVNNKSQILSLLVEHIELTFFIKIQWNVNKKKYYTYMI